MKEGLGIRREFTPWESWELDPEFGPPYENHHMKSAKEANKITRDVLEIDPKYEAFLEEYPELREAGDKIKEVSDLNLIKWWDVSLANNLNTRKDADINDVGVNSLVSGVTMVLAEANPIVGILFASAAEFASVLNKRYIDHSISEGLQPFIDYAENIVEWAEGRSANDKLAALTRLALFEEHSPIKKDPNALAKLHSLQHTLTSDVITGQAKEKPSEHFHNDGQRLSSIEKHIDNLESNANVTSALTLELFEKLTEASEKSPKVFRDVLVDYLEQEGYKKLSEFVGKILTKDIEMLSGELGDIKAQQEIANDILNELKGGMTVITSHTKKHEKHIEKQEKKWEEEEKEKEEEKERLKTKQRFKNASALSGAFLAFAKVTKNEDIIKVAKVTDIVTSSAAPVLYNLSQLLGKKGKEKAIELLGEKGKAIDWFSVAGNMANLSVVALNIALLFMNKGGPSFEETVLQELHAIRKQLADLQESIDAHFAILNNKLNDMFIAIINQFEELFYEIHSSSIYTFQYLERIESRIILLGQQVRGAVDSFWLRDLRRTIREVDNWQDIHGNLRDFHKDNYAKFDKCMEKLSQWLLFESKEILSNGRLLYIRNASNELINEIISDENIEHFLGYLNMLCKETAGHSISENRDLFNPAIWEQAAQCYFKLLKGGPKELIEKRDPKGREKNKVLRAGRDILEFYNGVQTNGELFSLLFAEYRHAVKKLNEHCNDVLHDYVGKNLQKGTLENQRTEDVREQIYNASDLMLDTLNTSSWFSYFDSGYAYGGNKYFKDSDEVHMDTWIGMLCEGGTIHKFFEDYKRNLYNELALAKNPEKFSKAVGHNKSLAPITPFLIVDYGGAQIPLPLSRLFNNSSFKVFIPDEIFLIERLGIGHFDFTFTNLNIEGSFAAFSFNCQLIIDNSSYDIFKGTLEARGCYDGVVSNITQASLSGSDYGKEVRNPFQHQTQPVVKKVQLINGWKRINSFSYALDPELDSLVLGLTQKYKEEYDRLFQQTIEKELAKDITVRDKDVYQILSKFNDELYHVDNLYKLLNTLGKISGLETKHMKLMEHLLNREFVIDYLRSPTKKHTLSDFIAHFLGESDKALSLPKEWLTKFPAFNFISGTIVQATQPNLNKNILRLSNPTHFAIDKLLRKNDNCEQSATTDDIPKTMPRKIDNYILIDLYNELFYDNADIRYQGSFSEHLYTKQCLHPVPVSFAQGKKEGKTFYFSEHVVMQDCDILGKRFQLTRTDIADAIRSREKNGGDEIKELCMVAIVVTTLFYKDKWQKLNESQKVFLDELLDVFEAYCDFLESFIEKCTTEEDEYYMPPFQHYLCMLALSSSGSSKEISDVLILDDASNHNKYVDFYTLPVTHQNPTENVEKHIKTFPATIKKLLGNQAALKKYNVFIKKLAESFVSFKEKNMTDESIEHYVNNYVLSKKAGQIGIGILCGTLKSKEKSPVLWLPEDCNPPIERNQSEKITGTKKVVCPDVFKLAESGDNIHFHTNVGMLCHNYTLLIEQTKKAVELQMKAKNTLIDNEQEEKNKKLLAAANSGATSEFVACLRDGAQLESVDEKGFNTLAIAISKGHEDIAKFLLKEDKNNVLTSTHAHTYPVHLPRRPVFEPDLEMLLDFVANNGDFSALMLAARYGRTNIVNKLLTLPNPDKQVAKENLLGIDATLLAALYGYEDIVLELIKAGGKTDYIAEVAATLGHGSLLKRVLCYQAKELCIKESLNNASFSENLDNAVMAIYLEKHAIVRQCYEKNHDEFVEKMIEPIKFCAHKGFDKSNYYIIAAIHDDAEMLDYLLDIYCENKKISKEAVVRQNENLCDFVSHVNDNGECLKVLLRNGAEINLPDLLWWRISNALEQSKKVASVICANSEFKTYLEKKRRQPFLHLAISKTKKDDKVFPIIKLLCEIGDDLSKTWSCNDPLTYSHPDILDKTPLDLAKEKGNSLLISYLTSRLEQLEEDKVYALLSEGEIYHLQSLNIFNIPEGYSVVFTKHDDSGFIRQINETLGIENISNNNFNATVQFDHVICSDKKTEIDDACCTKSDKHNALQKHLYSLGLFDMSCEKYQLVCAPVFAEDISNTPNEMKEVMGNVSFSAKTANLGMFTVEIKGQTIDFERFTLKSNGVEEAKISKDIKVKHDTIDCLKRIGIFSIPDGNRVVFANKNSPQCLEVKNDGVAVTASFNQNAAFKAEGSTDPFARLRFK